MTYSLTIFGYDSGLNELLQAQSKKWDNRTKRLIVTNPEKAKNDRLCCAYIRRQLRGVRITNPIYVHYHFYCPNKKHDKTNVAYAFCKSFLDSLQQCKVIQNDGWMDIVNVDFTFEVDRNNPRVQVDLEEVIKN